MWFPLIYFFAPIFCISASFEAPTISEIKKKAHELWVTRGSDLHASQVENERNWYYAKSELFDMKLEEYLGNKVSSKELNILKALAYQESQKMKGDKEKQAKVKNDLKLAFEENESHKEKIEFLENDLKLAFEENDSYKEKIEFLEYDLKLAFEENESYKEKIELLEGVIQHLIPEWSGNSVNKAEMMRSENSVHKAQPVAFAISSERKNIVKEEVDECWKEGSDWNILVRENERKEVEQNVEDFDESQNMQVVDGMIEISNDEEDIHSQEDSDDENLPMEVDIAEVILRCRTDQELEIKSLRCRNEDLERKLQHERGLRIYFEAELYKSGYQREHQSPRQFELPLLRKTPRGIRILESARSNGSASSGQKFMPTQAQFGRHTLKETEYGKELFNLNSARSIKSASSSGGSAQMRSSKSAPASSSSNGVKVPRLALGQIHRE